MRGHIVGLVFGGLTAIAAGLGVVACTPVPDTVVFSTETGEPVLLEDIDPILLDPDLTEDEKREQLLELGVPDDVIDVLLRAA